MNESSLSQIIDTALSKIRSVADSDTVIGEPVRLSDEVVVLPFSKISIGFAAGSADLIPKKIPETDKKNFAGGNGAGVSVTPLGFIIVNGTEVEVVNLNSAGGEGNSTAKAIEVLIEKVPEMIEKIKEKKKEKKEKEAEGKEAEKEIKKEDKKALKKAAKAKSKE